MVNTTQTIALKYAYFLDAAYQVTEQSPLQEQYPYFPAGYSLVYNIHRRDTCKGRNILAYSGFLAKSNYSPDAPTTYVLALRGSAEFLDWAEKLDILPSPGPFGNNSGNVVSGFLDMFNSMTFSEPGQIKPKGLLKYIRYSIQYTNMQSEDDTQPMVCTGHSLGAAMATLFAAGDAYTLHPCRLYTFGSPCVGDAAFVSFYNALITTSERYYNLPDLIPTLLDAFGYDHVHHGIPLDSLGDATVSWLPDCTHSLRTYMYLLGADPSVLSNTCLICDIDNDVMIKKLSFRRRY
ncbi:lipase family protein [Chitinophaga rhizophila]|uniref:Lipase family protein n=1 Tax=Chitinophaga rhizophila TaxID=2866212 RepID=A0ABS7GJW7_9BACT|nr:lipase family protein [Chitinophaga rhizophila]MBW8688009.1 lipase family protein [Chitinophaga rhizophila]